MRTSKWKSLPALSFILSCVDRCRVPKVSSMEKERKLYEQLEGKAQEE